MTSSALEQPAARTYRETAERFRAIVRNSPQQTVAKFLRDVDGALADLCSAGSKLPELEPDTDELPESNLPADRNQQLQGSLAQLLGQFDSYREIFDPTDPTDKEPVQYRVSLDLVEILDDQDYALSLLDPDRSITPADVVWQWRFGFTSHWGGMWLASYASSIASCTRSLSKPWKKVGRMPNKRLELAPPVVVELRL